MPPAPAIRTRIWTRSPGLTSPANFSSDGRFIATSTSASVTMGVPTGWPEITTPQLAVPPRCSGP